MDDKNKNKPCSTLAAMDQDSPAAKILAAEEEQKEADRRRSEKESKELSIRYSQPTRMGQWVEETQLIEEKCKEYEKRREACLTFYQKQSMVIDHLFAAVKIAKHEDLLKYNIAIQIQSDVTIVVPDDKPQPQLQLSVVITEHQIDTHGLLKLNASSVVTVSYDKIRIRRNVFTIVSVEKKAPRSPVLYGEDFFIRIEDTDGPELYLTGAVPNLDNFGETKGKVPILLTENPDRYAKFHIVDPNPDLMIGLQGTPVSTFARVSVSQTITNLLLAVELTDTVITSYSIDHPVDCFTYKDSRHRITSENFWKFVTQAIDEGAGDAENADVSSSAEAEAGPSNAP